MDKIVTVLASQPAVIWAVIFMSGVLLLFFIGIFSVAFLLGRSISLWPPKIGPREQRLASSGERQAKKGKICFEDIIDAIKDLQNKLAASRWMPDIVVASGRGGAVIAGMAADLFGRRPLKVIDIGYSYRHGKRSVYLDTTALKDPSISGKRILLVELNRYSGETASLILKELKQANALECRTFAISVLESCQTRPDYFVKITVNPPSNPWRVQEEGKE